MQAVLSSAFRQKYKVCFLCLETPGCMFLLFFWRVFFPAVFCRCANRQKPSWRTTLGARRWNLSVFILFTPPTFAFHILQDKKKICSFLPHSKQFADRLETLCAQVRRPNQFPNKSVTKDNLIDLRVCLSSRRCLQSEEGDGRAGRRSNEHLIHHSGRDAPTGPL